MKFLFDIFPIILFFVAFKFFGIYVATGVAIGATFLQIIYLTVLGKKIEHMLWINLVVITLFGGLTIFLKNELFIKWKPTILYTIFALGLFISDFFFKKNFLKTVMKAGLELPDFVWKRMNYSWVVFFLAMAALNLFVAYSFETETWVNFKLFGLIGLTLLFVFAQSVFLIKFLPKSGEKE